MPRTEEILMTGWEFGLMKCGPYSVAEAAKKQKVQGVPEEIPDIPEDLRFTSVRLPHDWAVDAPFDRNMVQGEDQGFRDRWGIGWYRRALRLEHKYPGYLYFMEFGGVYENCTVWVNEKCAGGHKYGYSTFRLDVTNVLQEGVNRILVRVDNSVMPADRWYSGCGIYRTVKLVAVEEKHLDPWEVKVKSSISGTGATVMVETGQDVELYGTLQEIGRTEGVLRETGMGGRLVFTVPEAKFWSSEEPNLYKLTLSLVDDGRITDELEHRIGIREISFDAESGMRVNKQPIKLKGVCLHQEAGCLGIAAKPEIWRERLQHLKELGCNAIRAAHHTFAEEFMAVSYTHLTLPTTERV